MGRPEVLKFFLNLDGVDLKTSTNMGRGPLLKAAFKGWLEIAKILIDSGKCDINQKDKHGQTALHQAVWGSNRGNLAEKVERKHKYDKDFNF